MRMQRITLFNVVFILLGRRKQEKSNSTWADGILGSIEEQYMTNDDWMDCTLWHRSHTLAKNSSPYGDRASTAFRSTRSKRYALNRGLKGLG